MAILPFVFSIVIPNVMSEKSTFTKERSITVVDADSRKVVEGCSFLIIYASPYTLFPGSNNAIVTSDDIVTVDKENIVYIESKLRYPAISLYPFFYMDRSNATAIVFKDGYKHKIIDLDTYMIDKLELNKMKTRKEMISEAHYMQSLMELYINKLSSKSYESLRFNFNNLVSFLKIDTSKMYWMED
jgi:hypothetical protein